MSKFSNSSFSSFPAALVWRLLVVYSHFKRAMAYELLYNRLSGTDIGPSAMNTRYAVSCWVFSGFPEIGVMLSASLLLTLQTATICCDWSHAVSVFGDSAQLIVVAQFSAARCHVVKLLIKLFVTVAGYLILNYTLVGAVLVN